MTDKTLERQVFVAALIGGAAGAAFGLLFLGGILFAPVLTALTGSALGPAALLARRRYAGRRQLTSS